MYGLAKQIGPNTPTYDGKSSKILDDFFLPKEAEFYSCRDAPEWSEMESIQRKSGATFFRYTYFDDTFPSEIYPHGFYLEGWREQPLHQAPFNWPMTLVP